jgi:hypothetical protein
LRPAENPFASRRVDQLAYRLAQGTLPDLIRRLEQLGGRGALVGHEGSGKTTLLEELARRLPGAAVLIRLGGCVDRPSAELSRQLPRPVTADHVLLVDAAERLGPLAWLRLRLTARRASGLVITSHHPGRLPTLLECRTSPELLAELVAELAPEECSGELDELYLKHGGNIRQCLSELYDRHAGRTR